MKAKCMEINVNDKTLIGERIGTVTVEVYKSVSHSHPFYYIKADKEEMLPVVDVLDDVLTCHSIHL